MRKALIGLILAATAITPVAAEAQRGRGHDGGEQRSFRGDRGSSHGDRGAQRQAPQQQAQAPAQAQQPQPQQNVRIADRRGDGNRGNWNRGDRGDGNRGNRGDGGGRGARQPSIYPQAWQGDPNSPDLRRYQRIEAQNQARYGRGDRGRDRDDRGRNWRGGDRDRDGDRGRNWRGGDRRNWAGDWNRGWRNDRRYDWSGWRYRNRNIFHLGRYYSPYRDWSYRRFSIGLFLEPLFFSQNYWIGDPWQYRLPPAPPGTRWIRYYDDVLLVDTYSGEVIDAIYDFFW